MSSIQASAARPTRLERALVALAVAYLALAAVLTVLVRSDGLSESALESSAQEVADGHLVRLFTSAVVVSGPLAVAQVALGALAAAVVIRREGPALWWVVAVVGHAGSALIAYAGIGLAAALGSDSADAAANDRDLGISCVLAATLGALLASGIRRRDGLIAALGVVSFLGLIPFSIGWLDVEHSIAYVLGAGVVFAAQRR